ncbi:methyltransferase domain-containing protein [Rhizobiaceae bacterium n13]|uniref:Methyltransferase domain-containing protein n=1 Tax=Ferirhizobium litorale TaxID=2927786 RepID=A0AAE3QB21_9HYPH|nr:methyltransferase domain-containing protein [Fererhizobium litorale]MDI7862219.1 methyltransferase domain-containing protein [Fererhizobium litorale]MDI7922507.1 methyltransferase domain-containing protein [Fererhizobium litorale]
MAIEERVSSHYTHGALEQKILDALEASGKDCDRLQPGDLSAVDEFHLGRHAATVELVHDLRPERDTHFLDIGAGIGGPARYLAEECGCRVTGIDLTEEFVSVATSLTRRCGLSNRVSFHHASALSMPFPNAGFDGAMLMHVGMNIEDKAGLFAEVRRVLKPGARFGIYDIMRVSDAELIYPMPWAATPETSFVETPDTYRRLLANAGFKAEQEHDRSAMALSLGQEMLAKMAENEAQQLGLHLIMGPATPERFGNVMRALEAAVIAPTEMIVVAA